MTSTRNPHLLCPNCGADAEPIFATFAVSEPGKKQLLLRLEDDGEISTHGCRSCHWLGRPAAADAESLVTLLDAPPQHGHFVHRLSNYWLLVFEWGVVVSAPSPPH